MTTSRITSLVIRSSQNFESDFVVPIETPKIGRTSTESETKGTRTLGLRLDNPVRKIDLGD